MGVGGRPGAIQAVDHVVVGVRDLEEATRTAALLLGREPSWRGVHPQAGTANALFRLDNTYLELLAPAAGEGGDGALGRGLAAWLDERGDGLFALALGTRDVEAFAVRMNAWDVDVGRPREGRGVSADGAGERRWFSVLLPAETSRGVPLLVIEHRSGALPALAPAEPTGVVGALDHVVIFSADLDGSRALYEELLGLRLALDRTFEARGQRILFFRVGGATVEVVGAADPASLPEGRGEGSDRLWGLAWRVDDVDAARERLVAAGLDISAVRPGAKPGTRVCTVRGEPVGVPTLLIAADGEDGEDEAEPEAGEPVR
jgi:catechol 2,3-dioxygenase-like lactoylglutathione lyase family enzyme